MARSHRIGQTKSVTVYRLIAKDTIDEEIIERARRKRILEFCLINNLDASSLGIKSKGPKVGKTDFTREELNSILKFGAQNMFKDMKAEEVDLDKILSTAEKLDTEELAKGTSHVGDEFLAQFKVQDVGDIEWDDIIPQDIKDQAATEAFLQNESELLGQRNRTQVNYNLTKLFNEQEKASLTNSNVTKKEKKTRTGGDMLSERELRSIARALMKFSAMRTLDIKRECGLETVSDAKISETISGMLSACRESLKAANSPEAEKKAETVYLNIKIKHPRPLIHRSELLDFLEKYVDEREPSQFRIPIKLDKVSHNWQIKWTTIDDAMLLYGTYRYGYGNWKKIVEDEELKLDKIKFQDPKSPNEDQVARRCESLLESIKKNGKPVKRKATVAEKSNTKKPKLQSSPKVEGKLTKEKSASDILRPITRDMTTFSKKIKREKLKSEKIKATKDFLTKFGSFINDTCIENKYDREFELSLWDELAVHWPNNENRSVEGFKLQKMFLKLTGHTEVETKKGSKSGEQRRISDVL
eukprot:NODE_304_length_10309_cov_0.478355.p2 type:complete len:528 gc:universal NODE_304_length_10309_cov_0.478355:7958-9541(+)